MWKNFLNWIVTNSPDWLLPAVSPMPGWDIWTWIPALGSLIAIGGFIIVALRATGRWLRPLGRWLIILILPHLAYFAAKVQTKAMLLVLGQLFEDLEYALFFSDRPDQIIALGFRNVSRGLFFLALGVLALVTLPTPFNLYAGSALIGIAVVTLLASWRVMQYLYRVDIHARKMLMKIEKLLRSLEGMGGEEFTVPFAEIRWEAWRLTRLAHVSKTEGPAEARAKVKTWKEALTAKIRIPVEDP